MSNAASMAVVDGIARRIVKKYGVVDGINRKVYKGYVVVGGINRLRYIAEALAFTGNMSEPQVVDIGGVEYDLYTLTSSGNLSIYADDALFWMCGGGAGGRTATAADGMFNGSGGGGAGAFCTSGKLTSGKYPIEIGAGGYADQDGSPTTLGEYTAEGGKTGIQVIIGGAGGTGGGGGDGSNERGMNNGAGGSGDSISKYPFGLTALYAHCAGGGGGRNSYSRNYATIEGGDGGSNGSNGKNGNDSASSFMYSYGGEKGGGNGGTAGNSGADATFYGSGGGGGGSNTQTYPYSYGKGGSGYQGVVYIAIPHKETIEPIVIIRQPQSQAAVAGDTVTLSVEATGVASYQWQYISSQGQNWGNLTWEGATAATMTAKMTAARLEYWYRCKLTGLDGSVVYTDVVYFAPIIITKQPEGGTIAIGDPWTFSVEATGVEKYRWQVSMDEGASWTNLTWAGSQTATMTRTGMNEGTISYHYRCMLTARDDSVVYTDVVTFTQA